MSIQSSPFSGTILSGEDSEKFVEQFLKNHKPNAQAIEAYKRGKKIMKKMQDFEVLNALRDMEQNRDPDWDPTKNIVDAICLALKYNINLELSSSSSIAASWKDMSKGAYASRKVAHGTSQEDAVKLCCDVITELTLRLKQSGWLEKEPNVRRLTYLLEDFKNIEENLIPGSIGAEVMEDYDNEIS